MSENHRFWRDAIDLQESATPRILRRTIKFGAFATLVCLLKVFYTHDLGLSVGPFEFAGAALGLLLVLRTNAGYERWWEARKLWGGIVNQTRNLAIGALAYGPDDRNWRVGVVRWTAAFPYAAIHSLRDDRTMPEAAALLGEEEAARIAASEHMPNFVALRIAGQLRQARDQMGMDRFAFLQIDGERIKLIDHIGACERILSAPLPRAYTIHIRRFILLYLTTLPFAMIDRVGLLTPLFTVLVAYPILSLDQIGMELQDPFSEANINHLPLDELCSKIERNLLALLQDEPGTLDENTEDLPAGRDLVELAERQGIASGGPPR
jgi:putative membrane protein